MKYSEEVADKLNSLLEKNYDAEKGYKLAAEKVKNPQLKSFFEKQAKNRYDFGHELKGEIANFGGSPDKGTSLKGDVHRGWMNLKASLAGDKDEAVLEEAVRGEKTAVEEYNDVINHAEVPASTGNVLMKQRNSITSALTEVEQMEEWRD